MTAETTLLVVEDVPLQAALYADYLGSLATVRTAGTGAEALAHLDAGGIHLMVLDLGLPDMDGLAVLEARQDTALPPTVVLTGDGSVKRAVAAMQAGAADFLMKPVKAERLQEAVRQALARRQPQGAPLAGTVTGGPPTGPSGFLGDSVAMRNVFALIEAAAPSAAPVFITGESGTGKELCARAIHHASARRDHPFLALNCAALPGGLMESEMFGHRKGAFTGAVADRRGAAAEADGGTLFLDEICEMDLELQAKLLRFIQEGTYRPVGDSREHHADIRFICATNRDPQAEVAAGRFREDLYYRLYVVPIHMPPLRERGEDIALLARRFLRDLSTAEGKAFRDFAPEALVRITSHAWPGNVRQLENAIRTLVVLNDGPEVTPAMLPDSLRDGPAAAPPDQRSWLVRPLVELEIMAIEAAIAYHEGNISRAARALEIAPSTIYRKQQQWSQRQTRS